MAILKTYDLRGNKLSFANWISNLSPTETPFASMIGKESVDQTMYSWQVDRLSAPSNAGVAEGAAFEHPVLAPTTVQSNFTQILRKVVRVTDTANKVGLYGRASEKAYQMEKAAKEIKRDLEWCMLHQRKGSAGTKATPREFTGFFGLVAPEGLPCQDTGGIVHKLHKYTAGDPAFTETEIFDLTYNLYLVGAKANKIMIHPMHMYLFSDMINKSTSGGNQQRLFDGLDTKFNMHVSKIRDPLGQEFTIIPNRHMPEFVVYFFNESDWSQMILRAPETRELAKVGSSERHMIEMEVGLRHKNPYASGILELKEDGGVSRKALVAYLAKNPATQNETVKLHVDSYADGILDVNATTHKISIEVLSGNGNNITKPVNKTDCITPAADGKGSADLAANRPGEFLIRAYSDEGTETFLTFNVHSADRSAPVTLEEKLAEAVIEAPIAQEAKVAKARKPKA